MLNDDLKKVAVVGAAGKMGRGIAQLLVQEMARLDAEQTGYMRKGGYSLRLIDLDEDLLNSLKSELRFPIRTFAEKSINALRRFFHGNPKLVSNEEMIEAFVERAVDMIHPDSDISAAKNSRLVFEAIVEDFESKVNLLSQLKKICREDAYYFTNTSSIPIGVLGEKSGLSGRLIGCHFYNPPIVQQLVELIPPRDADPRLVPLAKELAIRLGKTVVVAKDVSGFIGNGHLIREIEEACRLVETVNCTDKIEAIAFVNHLTQTWLLRPMGTFQLLDYVGIDVCQNIMTIMKQFLGLTFQPGLVEEMFRRGKWGGQNPDGTQKEGFFAYEGRRPIQVFSIKKNAYVPIPEQVFPSWGVRTWKDLHKDKNKERFIKDYLKELFRSDSKEAKLAQQFLMKSREIAHDLVEQGVAESIDDVNTVLMDGFYHLYGVEAFINNKGHSL